MVAKGKPSLTLYDVNRVNLGRNWTFDILYHV